MLLVFVEGYGWRVAIAGCVSSPSNGIFRNLDELWVEYFYTGFLGLMRHFHDDRMAR